MRKRPQLPHRLDEGELQYHVELWSKDGNRLEKCVGACSRADLARPMMPKAIEDFPGHRVIIRQGALVIADGGQ